MDVLQRALNIMNTVHSVISHRTHIVVLYNGKDRVVIRKADYTKLLILNHQYG